MTRYVVRLYKKGPGKRTFTDSQMLYEREINTDFDVIDEVAEEIGAKVGDQMRLDFNRERRNVSPISR